MFCFSPFHSHFPHLSEVQVWPLCFVLLQGTVTWPRGHLDSSPNFPLTFLVSFRNHFTSLHLCFQSHSLLANTDKTISFTPCLPDASEWDVGRESKTAAVIVAINYYNTLNSWAAPLMLRGISCKAMFYLCRVLMRRNHFHLSHLVHVHEI